MQTMSLFIATVVCFSWLVSGAQGHDNALTRKKDPVVYFRAYLSGVRRYGVGSTVVFDKVDANTDGVYNEKSGIFTAPVSGLYEFNCQLQTIENGVSEYQLKKQGSGKSTILTRAPWKSKSMSDVLYVSAGDHVWIQKVFDDGKNSNLREGNHSYWSGYLLRKIEF